MATEQIPTTLIADDAVTTAKINADAVTNAKIGADADIEIRDRRDELFDLEIEKFVEGIMGTEYVENKQPTWF